MDGRSDLITRPPPPTSFLSSSLWRSQMLCVWPLGLSPTSTFSPQLQSFHNSCTGLHCHTATYLSQPWCMLFPLSGIPSPFLSFFFPGKCYLFVFSLFHFCTCIAILLYRYRCSVSLSMQLQGLLPEALQTPHPLSCSERHLTLLLCVGAVCSQPVSTLWVRMDLLPRF